MPSSSSAVPAATATCGEHVPMAESSKGVEMIGTMICLCHFRDLSRYHLDNSEQFGQRPQWQRDNDGQMHPFSPCLPRARQLDLTDDVVWITRGFKSRHVQDGQDGVGEHFLCPGWVPPPRRRPGPREACRTGQLHPEHGNDVFFFPEGQNAYAFPKATLEQIRKKISPDHCLASSFCT